MQNIEKVVTLHRGEQVILQLRQSYLSSISPDTLVLTDRRVILIHNSFWGLYIHRNIMSPTKVSTVLLNNIMGTTTANGKILSTVDIRIRGSDVEADLNTSVWKIEGIRIKNAMKFNDLIEDLVEGRSAANEVDMENARKLIEEGKSYLIWFGIEDVNYVSYLLGIDKSKIIRLNPSELSNMSSRGLRDFDGKILACYTGNISTQIALFLKNEYRVNAFVLKGGLAEIISRGKMGKNNNVSGENDIAGQ